MSAAAVEAHLVQYLTCSSVRAREGHTRQRTSKAVISITLARTKIRLALLHPELPSVAKMPPCSTA